MALGSGGAKEVRTPDVGTRLAAAGFGLALLIGILGAFVGLDASSLWTDELFTAWVVSPPDLAENARRLLTDVNPPIYYIAITLYTKLVGDSDVALRSFSAICATASLVLFVTATRPFFSLNARLFAAAIATASGFWFFQSQNARGYALALLFGVAVLALGLRIVSADPSKRTPRTRLASLFAVMLLGQFVHFYLLYQAIAVLMMTAVVRPREKYTLAILAITLFAIAEYYIIGVIGNVAVYSTKQGWIPSAPAWYIAQLRSVVMSTVNSVGLAAILLCAGLILGRALRAYLPGRLEGGGSRARSWGIEIRAGIANLREDKVLLLCVGTPAIVVVGGLLSSLLLAPNFTDRNILTVSPFLWAFFAWLYDRGVAAASAALRWPANLLAVVLLLAMASVAIGRAWPRNEPYRETAQWIRSVPACRGAKIPVVELSRSEWSEPTFLRMISQFAYQRYLGEFATATVILGEELETGKLSPSLRSELQERLDGRGCPVIAWSAHLMDEAGAVATRAKLLAVVGRKPTEHTTTIKSFTRCNCGLRRRMGVPEGFVFHAAPPIRSKAKDGKGVAR